MTPTGNPGEISFIGGISAKTRRWTRSSTSYVTKVLGRRAYNLRVYTCKLASHLLIILPISRKAQLETKLRKWGLRKNIPRELWCWVEHAFQDRAAAGKKSLAILSGRRLDDRKVKNEIRRNSLPTLALGQSRIWEKPTEAHEQLALI